MPGFILRTASFFEASNKPERHAGNTFDGRTNKFRG